MAEDGVTEPRRGRAPLLRPRRSAASDPDWAASVNPYYSDDHVSIFHGDAFELADQLVDQVDAVVTDPPYGVGLDYGPEVEDTPELVDRCAGLVPVLTRAPCAAITSGILHMFRYPTPTWVGCWHLGSPTGLRSPWGFSCWGPILFYGADPYLARGRGSRPDTFNQASSRDGPRWIQKRIAGGHPAPKPPSLGRWLVARTTPDPGMTILDPFCGSGVFLAAAKYSGRRAIGVEISERWCEVAATRLTQSVLDFSDSQTPAVQLQLAPLSGSDGGMV